MRLSREDDTTLVLPNEHGIDVRVFANKDVSIEQNAVDELSELLDITQTIERIQDTDPEFFDDDDPRIMRVAVTPDFHKGRGTPIGMAMLTKGFIVPQTIGADINCGMRLYVTDASEDKIRACVDDLAARIRHVFFQGGRQLPMRRAQREAMLQYGLAGLLETRHMAEGKGLWSYFDASVQEKEAPYAYKEVGAVTATPAESNIARVVAELEPILTVKG